MAYRDVIFKKEVIPALAPWLALLREAGSVWEAYKTPMLMANSAPIFSLGWILACQMIFHGIRAKAMSVVPEYAARAAGQHRRTNRQDTDNSPATKVL